MTEMDEHKKTPDSESDIHRSVQTILQQSGAWVWNFFEYVGGVGVLIARFFGSFFVYPVNLRYVVHQIYDIGVKSITLVTLVSIFTGMVMALQFVVGLKRFGLQLYAGQVVGVAMTRELGPVLTSLMVAARVGSGIAAEIGSMEVSEQILAIRAMGGSPIAKLVVPRVLVTTIVTPILTVFSIFIGILGGMFVSMLEAGVTAKFYLDQIQKTVEVYDFFSGVTKTVFFGFLIGCIACYQGLNTRGGTKGVGISTTRTVVFCSMMVFVMDFFLTKLFLLF